MAVSRSFGDIEFKLDKEWVTCMPDILSTLHSNFLNLFFDSLEQVTSIPLTADIDFVVIGCDGLYDEMSDDDIVSFINDGFAHEKALEDIAKELVEEAIELGSTDNVSVIIVKLDKKFQKLITKSAQLEVSL